MDMRNGKYSKASALRELIEYTERGPSIDFDSGILGVPELNITQRRAIEREVKQRVNGWLDAWVRPCVRVLNGGDPDTPIKLPPID